MKLLTVSLALAACGCAGPRDAAHTPATRPAAYWQAIVDAGYALPAGAPAFDLIVELSGFLGSTDSKLRDDYAYAIPAAWIYGQEQLDARELLALVDLWTPNLEQGLGRSGDDSVLLRSFSALNLALLAAYDNKRPYLERQHFDGLLAAALAYLERERDLRGWTAEAGWHHSAAHTADLLKFLARSRHLQPEGQRRILAGVARRLRDTNGYVFVHGEDERLAAAVSSVIARDDFDAVAFEEFVGELATPTAMAGFEPLAFAARQNAKNLLRALHVNLARPAEPEPELVRLQRLVLEALWAL